MSERVYEYSKFQTLRGGWPTNHYCGPVTLHEIDNILNGTPVPTLEQVAINTVKLELRETMPGFLHVAHFLEDIETYANYLGLLITGAIMTLSATRLFHIPEHQAGMVEVVEGKTRVRVPALQVLTKPDQDLHVETYFPTDNFFKSRTAYLLDNGFKPTLVLTVAPE